MFSVYALAQDNSFYHPHCESNNNNSPADDLWLGNSFYGQNL